MRKEDHSATELARAIVVEMEDLALTLEELTDVHPDWPFLLEQFFALNQLYDEVVDRASGLVRQF